MGRSRRPFALWFAALLAASVAVNLAGAVRPRCLKPIRWVGFPMTFAAWGPGMEGGVDGAALLADAAVAVVASAAVAWACAASRAPARASGPGGDAGTPPNQAGFKWQS